MRRMKFRLLTVFCCVLSICSCKDGNGDEAAIYIGGQINNPETDYVVISRENESIDTLYLNSQNQFGKAYDSLEPGIYTFKHPPESQIMYIEEGDSLVLWLNTLAFDQSLNFSGRGAKKSNFLKNMFLKNQDNNDLILSYYKVQPDRFSEITDSIRQKRLGSLQKLEENNDFSEEFLQIAEASIDYEYYDLMERYTFLVRKYYPEMAKQLPEDFNDYRKQINFSNEQLQDYYVYTNLIDDYLRTRSIEKCNDEHGDHDKCFDLDHFDNISKRIRLIDSLSNIPSIKNEFIDRLAYRSLVSAETESRLDSILSLMREIKHDHYKDVLEFSKIQRGFLIGTDVSSLNINSTDGEILTYGDIVTKPTVFFLWSLYAPSHHKWQHGQIRELRKEFPGIAFIGINLDMNESEEWIRTLETYGYNKQKEFQVTRRNLNQKSLRRYINKLTFVDENGIIFKNNALLGTPALNESLEALLKS